MPNNRLGLVGHWTFDGKDMINNVADSSGQGKTGYMVAAATSSQQTPGVLGQALKFDGSTQYVNEPTSISGIKSVGFWAQTASTTAQGLINIQNDAVTPDYISTNANKALSGTSFTSPTYYVDGAASTTPGLYNANWHYIVVTNTAAITGSHLEIGRAHTQYFSGSIDDVRVYNRALSAAEVLQLYALGTGTHQNTTLNPPNLKTGLVGHWTFDGKDMIKNVADSSGQGNNGFIKLFTSTTTVPGPIGQALSFPSLGYVDVGTGHFTFSKTSAFSGTAWYKGTAGEIIFSDVNLVSSPGWYFQTGIGTNFVLVNAALTNSLNVIGSKNVQDNKWHFVAFTYDGSVTAAGIKIYSDGGLDSMTDNSAGTKDPGVLVDSGFLMNAARSFGSVTSSGGSWRTRRRAHLQPRTLGGGGDPALQTRPMTRPRPCRAPSSPRRPSAVLGKAAAASVTAHDAGRNQTPTP